MEGQVQKPQSQDHHHHDGDHEVPAIVIMPTPGMGHLIPLAELAKRLVHHHNFTVAFIIPTDGQPSKAQKFLLNSLPPTISHTFLPPVNFDDLPEDTKIETIISLTLVRSLPSFRDSLKNLIVSGKKPVGLVVDLFGTDAFEVAKEFNISPFIFFPSSGFCLSLFLYLPTLDETVTCEYRELSDPVPIPGCIPVQGKDLLDPVQDRKNEAYKWVLHHTKRYKLADGVMLNSFMELEPGVIKYLLEERPDYPRVFPVGPLVNMDSSRASVDGSDPCLKWLDEQPNGSVLYVSFGSGGTLTSDQMNELALGLELSGQKFLWVVRSPNDKASNAAYFTVHSQNDPFNFLPKGFLERTKEKGLVVPSWAPQAQVLSHVSTGGFLTHCGWNSSLEGVSNGVPLIVWPLFAEQKMNAIMLAEDAKIALSPKVGNNEKGLVEKEEIAKVVRDLLEGEGGKRIRSRTRELKEAAAKGLSEDGSSTKALSGLAQGLRTKIALH